MSETKQEKKVNPIIAKRLKEIMDIRGYKQVDVLERAQAIAKQFNMKFTKSTLSQYINGKNTPGQDKTMILAMALDVDEGWLLGFNSHMERRNNAADADQASNRIAEFVELFSLLDDNQKDLIIRQIKGILSSK